ncbi:unnamed protein product [Rhodiola kirilowii]
MKRKDFENVYDDFSCFSLAASARKSRRLDCELPPIIEEEPDIGIPVVPDHRFLLDNSHPGNVLVPTESPISVVPANDASEELAVVLYNPSNAATQGLVRSPSSSNFSFVMNTELLSGWRSHMLHQGNQSRVTITELDEESDEYKSFQSNNSMAVVPWVSSQQHPHATASDTQSTDMPLEPTEADADCEMMETDDHSNATGYSNQCYITNNGIISGTQAPLLPHQPHCLMPQYPSNTYTPIRW